MCDSTAGNGRGELGGEIGWDIGEGDLTSKADFGIAVGGVEMGGGGGEVSGIGAGDGTRKDN